MPRVSIKNQEFRPLQITLESVSGELHTLTLGRRQTIVIDEERLTEDVKRKSKAGRIKVTAYRA